jgi:hypothetical protein
MTENSPSGFSKFVYEIMFPGTPLSQEAREQIAVLFSGIQYGKKMDSSFYRAIFDILIKDQVRQGLRVHKGYPLYYIAESIGSSDRAAALEAMLGAFVEDVLTFGHGALSYYAASSLSEDFGLSAETLVKLEEVVLETAKRSFYPSLLVNDFMKQYGGDMRVRELFQGVSEASRLDATVAQVRLKVESELRPIITTPVESESQVQAFVFSLLRQIDPFTEREKTLGKFAGKESKIDFAMMKNQVGIEVKVIREKSQYGGIVDQVNADLAVYPQSLARVIFVVYDACGAISDTSKFCVELKGGRTNVEVLAVKH